jgi:hypothetical protein
MEERRKLVMLNVLISFHLELRYYSHELISLLLVFVARCFISHLWYIKLLVHLAVFSVTACEMWCSLHHEHIFT